MSLAFDAENHLYSYSGEHIPGCNEIAKSLGLINTDFYTEEGALRGKRRHSLIDSYDQGEIDWAAILPEDSHVVVGWQEFRDDTGFRPTDIELQVVHEDYWYAGTIDRIGEIAGIPYVIDLKTGSSLSLWYEIQVALYALAYARQNKTGIPRMGIVHLRQAKKQQYRFIEVGNEMLDVAYSVVLAYHAQQGKKDRAVRMVESKLDWLDDLAETLESACGPDNSTRKDSQQV